MGVGAGLGPVYPHDVLTVLSQQRGLLFTPGTRHVYSNTGYFLLSQVVERVSGERFSDFVEEHLFRPLAMDDTYARTDLARVIPRRATGYVSAPNGEFRTEDAHWGTLGDSGVLSTVLDLARWEADFHHAKVGDAQWRAAMTTPGVLRSGETLAYASGLMVGTCRGLPTISHSGRIAGFRAELLRFPEQALSAIVLCNTASADASRLALAVAATALEWEVAPQEVSCLPAEPIDVSSAELDMWVGTYGDASTGMKLRVTRADEQLVAHASSAYALVPRGDHRFLLDRATVVVPVQFAGRSPERTMTLVGGQLLHEDVPRRPYALSPHAVTDYVGRYHSPELAIDWTLESHQGALTISGRHVNGTLLPLGADEFSLDETSVGGSAVFERDAQGVSGFRLSGGPASGIRFTRVLVSH